MYKSKLTGIFLALITGSLWGFSGPIGKILAQNGTDMVTVVFLRSLVVCVITGLWIILFYGIRGVRVRKEELPFLIILGIMNVLFTAMGFLLSLKYLSVPVALLIHYLFPIATIVGEILIFGQIPSKKRIFAAFLVLIGLWIGMLHVEAKKAISLSAIGILWGLLAVVGLASQSLMGKVAVQRQYDYKIVLFYSHIFGTILLGLIKLLSSGMVDVLLLTYDEWFLISMIGILGGVLPYAAFFISLRYISSSLASLLCTSEIVVGMLMSAFLLLAPPSSFEIAGACVIVLAIGISVS